MLSGAEHRDLPYRLGSTQVVRPLAMILVALVISFVPAGICLATRAGTNSFLACALAIALAGTYFLPGVLLTMITSGSVVDLRPDRLLKTISLCGPRYISPLLSWIIAAAALRLGQTILAQSVDKWVNGHVQPSWLNNALIAWPLLCLGIIVLHFCCFELGMLYRRHHAAFPWLFQHTSRSITPAELPRFAPRRIPGRDGLCVNE